MRICNELKWGAMVCSAMCGNLSSQIGSPDLVILFTNTVSHKMARCAVVEAERANANIIRCHTSSQAALNEILDKAAAV